MVGDGVAEAEKHLDTILSFYVRGCHPTSTGLPATLSLRPCGGALQLARQVLRHLLSDAAPVHFEVQIDIRDQAQPSNRSPYRQVESKRLDCPLAIIPMTKSREVEQERTPVVPFRSLAIERIKPIESLSSDKLDLAAAAMAALRRSRSLAQILLWISSELLFALGATEVVCLPFVLGSSGRGSRFYIHAAYRIFHSCCAIHCDLLRSVRAFLVDGRAKC